MSSSRPAAALVLAAGEGTRMRSSTPKVLHPLAGVSMLGHAVAAVRALEPEHLVLVVRHERERVAAHALDLDATAVVADQDDIPGTGRAVQCGLEALDAVRDGAPLSGTVLVTYGDVPLLTGSTLADLVTAHEAGGHAVSVITAVVPDPSGYGRIMRDADGLVTGIVEHKDADPAQRAIAEINSGLYAFDAQVLTRALSQVGRANAQGEMYLTDVLQIARAGGGTVSAHRIDDLWQTEGVNDRVQLARLAAELNRRLIEHWMREGVTVVDPASTWIDAHVRLERDVTILPGVQLHGSTTVAQGATIGPDTTLTDCRIGPGASIVRTHGEGAVVGAQASTGPFSFLRPGTRLGDRGRVGAFVETKNAVIGTGSKVPHLSYVGDAEIGDGVNIGAATVFVNYDGVDKHRTVVGDHARVGSDTMLVAPLILGAGAYTAAGSVITQDVPPGAMAVARGQQRNVLGWVERRRAGSPSALAAEASRRDHESEPEAAAAGQPEQAVEGDRA